MKPPIGSAVKLNSRPRRVLCLVCSALLVMALIRPYLSSRTLTHLLGSPRPDLFYWKTKSRFDPVSLAAPKWTPNAHLCRSFPHRTIAELVQPVFRTGHLDVPERLGAQFSSVSACFKPGELLVISDTDEVLAGHPAHDVLARLPDAYRKDSPEFANYTYLQMLHTQHKLDRYKSQTDKQGPQINGWMIDKFKFLPMVELAWQLHPEKPWYFFYESDTYVVWDNVFRFLENLDPNIPLYLGSPSPGESLNETTKSWFAYGGAGFALNRGAMKRVLEPGLNADGEKVTLSQRWEDRIRHDCCGDSVLGWALLQAGVSLSGFWPHFNPHPLLGIPYSANHWCQPVLTMHKTDPEDMVELWRWEQSRRENNRPLLYRHLFQHTVHEKGRLKDQKMDWYNGARGAYKLEKATTPQICKTLCATDSSCLQYTWHHDECVLENAFSLGGPRPPEPERAKNEEGRQWSFEQRRTVSGWNRKRIEAWAASHKCHVVEWLRPSIERIF